MSDLQKFAESLAPPEAYVDKAKAVVDRMFKLLQNNSQYEFDRCRVLGGLEKKTSTFVKVFIYYCLFQI